jgi:nucleoside-diphosphate-sugar epimerase
MTGGIKSVVITGGAGFLGSALTAKLLFDGFQVCVLDNFLYGGDALLPFLSHPNFSWICADTSESGNIKEHFEKADVIIHCAAITGFPACQSIGRELAIRYNVEMAAACYKMAGEAGAGHFVFLSTYTAFGALGESAFVTENAPGNPQTVYAETKIEAEKRLMSLRDGGCPLTILRLADLYGLSPRTRFDVLINQMVWQALSRREIVIYQKGYWRSFIHISDAIQGILTTIQSPKEKTAGEVFNLGSNKGNCTKDELAAMVCELIPGTRISKKDISFGGYRRDLRGDFSKIKNNLGFDSIVTPRDGIVEIKSAILSGLIRDPEAEFHHNARFPVI